MTRNQNQPHGSDAAGNALGNAGDALQIAQNNQNPFNVGDTIQIGLNDNTITGKDVLPMNPVVEQREVPIGNINLAPGAVARITDPIRGNVTITGGTKDNIPNTITLEGNIQPQSIRHNSDTGELEVTMMGNNDADVAGMENA